MRLVGTSGRTKRQIADDLGVGLSTLTRWLARRRDCAIDMPDASAWQDATAELKRFRRENEILRQEHPRQGRAGHCPLYRRLLQSSEAPFGARPPQPRPVRATGGDRANDSPL